MGCDLHCCSHETKESSHCPVRRPEICGKAHRHICLVDGLSTQNTLRIVLYTVSIGRCLCTHAPCRFRGGMAIQRDALSTSTPPNTGTYVTVQSKYHTDSTTLIGVIGIEWRKPAILLPPNPCLLPTLAREESSMDPRLGAWYFGDLAHTAATTGSKWGPTAGQRVRKDSREVSPKEARQGAAARILRQGCRSPHANRRRTTHSLTHAQAPLPPRSAILSLIPTERSGCSGLPKDI